VSARPTLAFDHAFVEQARSRLDRFPRQHCTAPGRPAAVAVVLVPTDDGQVGFLITRRTARLANHPGQWALPGGRLDDGEAAPDAARRELAEELGLELGPESLVGLLDDYPTRSGFVITPVVLAAPGPVALVPNPAEVAHAYTVPVTDLGLPGTPRFIQIPESDRLVIQVPLLGALIHAPTGAVLHQFHEVVVADRPTRVIDYDQPVWAWR
jgi:8-oxo-dGTP pyrophosphatase MutT (NUDIX family)